MEIKVNFLDKLRQEAKFDDFTVIADQPICYKRNIPTEHIRLSHNNIVYPENRYMQTFKIQVELPPDISEKDRLGILRSIDRCTVKKVIQTGPEFVIEEVENLDADAQALLTISADAQTRTFIAGKDLPL